MSKIAEYHMERIMESQDNEMDYQHDPHHRTWELVNKIIDARILTSDDISLLCYQCGFSIIDFKQKGAENGLV